MSLRGCHDVPLVELLVMILYVCDRMVELPQNLQQRYNCRVTTEPTTLIEW